MDFTEASTARGVRVSDEDMDILSLTVDPSGRCLPRSVPTVGHVSLDGQLREVVTPSCGYEQLRFGSSGAELTLGTHPVAQQIRELGLAARPVAVMNRLRASLLLLPPGASIGPARAIPCFAGRDDDRARYTISYSDAEPVDVYAPLHA